MHIAHISLTNFTAYESLELDLHPGLNTIIGQSNIGKSQLLRALRWVFANDLTYDEVCRVDNGDKTNGTEVIVTFSNGTKVKRYQGPGNNGYTLTHSDNTELTFTNMGRSVVPDEISRASGLSYEAGDSLINFARQRGAGFFVDHKPRERMQLLAELSPHVQAFNTSAEEARKIAARRSREASAADGEIESVRTQLEELGDLDAFEETIDSLEDHERKLRKLLDTQSTLVQYAEAIRDSGSLRETSDGLIREAVEFKDRLTRLGKSLSQCRELQSALRDYGTALKNVPKGDPATGRRLRESLLVTRKQLETARSKQRVLQGYLDSQAALDDAEYALKSAGAALRERRLQVLREAGVCPLCEQEIAI